MADVNVKEVGLSETLHGEVLLKKVMCQIILAQNEWFEGDLVITNYKVEYIISKGKVKQNRRDALSIPLQFLSRIERNIDKKQNDIQIIDIFSKDGRFLKLKFLRSQNQDSMDVFAILQKTVFSDLKDTLFAFAHFQPDFESKWDGWNIYNTEQEFQRQGIHIAPENNQTNSDPVIVTPSSIPSLAQLPLQVLHQLQHLLHLSRQTRNLPSSLSTR